jgi:integrase
MLENLKTNECRVIDISQRERVENPFEFDFNSLVPTTEVNMEDENQYQELAKKQRETQGMDALPLDLYEQMLKNCLIRRDFRSVFWLTAMANFGLRYSDVVKLRRVDFIDENNRIRDSILIQEKKTQKQRICFVNNATKMALLMLLWNRDFAPTDYLIASEGTYKGYEVETYINEQGKERAVRKNGKYVYKLDEYGRKISKPLSRCQSETIMKKIIVENLGYALKNDYRYTGTTDAIGKICTHSIRKLYGWAVTNYFINNFDNNVAYAHSAALSFLSQDYGHSSEAMTLHYSKDFDNMKKEIVMKMNLGLEILKPYFEVEQREYMKRRCK